MSDAEPQGETAETPSADGAAALDDAVEWFSHQLDRTIDDHTEGGEHPERPTTAREWFTDVRGYDEETVEEKRLGWVPADATTELLQYLNRNGHDSEAVRATGLFTEDLRLLWHGRYVFPYLDRDGRAAYAIGRTTGSLGGGAAGYDGHPEDFLAGKYAKLAHTRDYVTVDEPIYGLGSLKRDTPVLITEGVADAVRAHEAGYACLSPVTTQFKKEHREQLVAVLEDTGRRAYIVQDAERPIVEHAEEADGWDALGVEQFGEGVKGAARTAAFLTDAGVEAYLAELPRLGLDKVDLDDYLGEWADTLDPVLAGAKPGDEHPAYEETTRSASTGDGDTSDWSGSATGSTGGSGSDLTAEDVRDALDHVSSTLSYDEWIQLGYAVHAWDAGDDGEEIFTEWSKESPKWEEPTSANAIDWIWSNASGVEEGDVGKVTVGTLVARAKRGGWEPPRRDDPEEYDGDPRGVSATVDPRRAWSAAGRVSPADLEGDELETTADGEAFASPSGETVDVVRAVAIAEGLVDGADAPLDDAYPEAYALAREEYDAPLPEYYTTADAVAEFDAVLDVIGEVSFFQFDTEALASDVTEEGEEVGGEAVRALNPAWRESDSEASVLVFESGTIWDADTERVLDALRFVALDSGLIDEPGDPLAGEEFTEAYRRARTEYAAPLPRWEPAKDGAREITPHLPPSEELVDARDLGGVDIDDLQRARDEVEELIREATGEADEATVVTALPATGKTTGTVKTAGVRPLSYLAPRKELQAQALDKAERWGVEAEVLPVFSEERVRDEVLAGAVSHVREHGKGRLRDRWAILSAAFDDLGEEEDGDDLDLSEIFTEEEEDGETVDLQRPTCETAEGDHGVAWALAVHVARRLGYTPREIHTQARGLFGAELPCNHGEEESCEYGDGWDRVTDPDDAPDLLVGSYTHAHVDSVRTEFSRGGDGSVETAPRAVVLDEFIGEAFVGEFDEKAEDFATWLGGCLREDVADRRDMLETDLAGDEFVTAWLAGDGGEATDAIAEATSGLSRTGDLLDAREAAIEVLAEVDSGTLEELCLRDPLEAVRLGDDPVAAYDTVEAGLGEVDRTHPRSGIAGWVDEAVREPLEIATAGGRAAPTLDETDVAELPVAGDLEALVDEAVAAVTEGRDGARDRLAAAVTALRGGPEGCRRLAAWADDGYAHPDAHHILEAVVDEDPDRISTSSWAFDDDATDGTVLDVADTGDSATTILDRNGHGARIHTPPARTDASGEDVPLVGLDATGRAPLWSVALGEEVATADIHDTPQERAAFLEDVLDLRVIQAADRPRPYEGDPTTKDTDGDVALLESLAEEYAGIEAPRERGDEATQVGRPAAITTKGVRELLENDTRLDDVVTAWDHYGNVTGSNELGGHRLGAVLGSQHYGDHAVERFCALAGEEVDTSRIGGRGAALDYGSALGNTYLKHMREDQTTQAILRFARGDSGATVVARTSSLREDLPLVGEGQVVETWSDTATEIAAAYRRLGEQFTIADVADTVDVTRRQVRRVLAELTEAGYLDVVGSGPGVATEYEPAGTPSAGEVELPERGDAVAGGSAPGRNATYLTYTWNVRVFGGDSRATTDDAPVSARHRGGPPAPSAAAAAGGGDPPET